MAELAQASGLSADLRAQFNKATDASNRAVMADTADTDQASVAFAHDAAQNFTTLEHDVAELTPLSTRQIVTLSRQNSNVRSLNLSLRVTPPLSAACDDSLRSLQQALAKEGSKATR